MYEFDVPTVAVAGFLELRMSKALKAPFVVSHLTTETSIDC